MSILNSTRINFFGGIEVDVSVPNNETDYPIIDTGKLATDGTTQQIFDVANSELTDFIYDNNITDDQIIALLRDPAKGDFTQGGWNIYGQHSVTTNQAKVRSAGLPGSVSTESPLANMPFYLLGSVNPETGQNLGGSAVMVDLNPLGFNYSQVVLGGIMIGNPDAPLLHLQGDRIAGNTGLFPKIVNGAPESPGSSTAAGNWQVTFTMEEIVASAKSSSAEANAFINAFLATPGATGIVINFSFFEMCPKMTIDQLRKSYGLNQNERNPSVGRIIGTIAIAFEGETAQFPDGRMLTGAIPKVGAPQTAYADIHKSASGEMLSMNLALALQQENFRTDRDGYTADTLNPAIDAGTLSVLADTTVVASITSSDPINYTNYYLYGGIFDSQLTSAHATLANGEALKLQSADQDHGVPEILLNEQAYTIFSSTKDVYMGEYAGDTQDVELQVRYLGKPVTEELTINVAKGNNDFGLSPDSFLDLSTSKIVVPANQASVIFTLENATGTDASSGFEQVEFSYGNDCTFFVYTRKFKHTDFGIDTGATVTWDEVYKYALRYHYLNFLGMSTVFPLNNAQQITINSAGIKARTSSKYWPTSLYMPIVRSMSPSQVRLINAFSESSPWDPKVEI